jgi:hypothetical protein
MALPTVVSILKQALTALENIREDTGRSPAAREFSIAITAVEDAIMRTNRGFAIGLDRFTVADVEQDFRDEL